MKGLALWKAAFLLGILAMACLAGGCATTQEYSDQPWNQPQPWEGVIPFPGMEGRY
ncbi:MAG: hypothetical protein U1E27_00250 [Kiritimatiellia bacterium]|nr:hypothetical protein [Kiritimatiellia bacterium]